MTYLLDTVAAIRWWSNSPRLGKAARMAIADGDETVRLSSVSVWEIANKNHVGKLPEANGFVEKFDTLLRASRFELLHLTAEHAMCAGYLSGAHRDPFDRLLAGQALAEGMIVITNDPQIAAFGCETLW